MPIIAAAPQAPRRMNPCSLGGVGLAIVVEVGQIDGHRMPLLRKIIRAHPKNMSQDKLKEMVLTWLARNLAANELALSKGYCRSPAEKTAPLTVSRLV